MPTIPTPLLTAALDLARRGWQVLPCHPTGTRAKAPIARLVPNGHRGATRSPAVIREWWTRCPTAMIGICVDPRLVIIDIDPRNGGAISAIEALTGCEITGTRTVWSGRGDGGRHLYYWRPDGPLTAHRLPVGVDLKTSGYVIAPPSIHPATGQPYIWDDQPLNRMPPDLLALLAAPAPVKPAGHGTTSPGRGPTGLIEFVAAQPWGNINNGLHWAACRAVEHGWLDNTLSEELAAAAVAAGETDSAARRTIRSAERTALR
jgi:hypothetical protein